jgi:RHS repeat-associated protein
MPCYNSSYGWCYSDNGYYYGELVGYGQITVTTKNFDGATTLAVAIHKFYTDEQKAGAEYETQRQDASGTILSQTNTTYTVSTTGLPTGGYFTYPSAVDQYLRSGSSLNRVSHTEYTYNTTTGNLTNQKEFDGTPSLYRELSYQYVVNTSPSFWILDRVWDRVLKNASGTILSKQQFGYDGNLPGNGTPTLGSLTLSRVVSGSQTIDVGFVYDSYGNLTQTRSYSTYGNVGSQPGGSYRTSSIAYDTTLYTYPISTTNSLNQSTSTNYDYSLGVPLSVTDLNGGITTTTYNGLGQPLTVKYPGYSQPNVQYTYPAPNATAPFAVKMDVLDEPSAVYRSVWQVFDGLGRILQSQSPDQTAGSLILTDTSYDALGRTRYSGLPRTLTGAGGNYFAPTWASVPHNTTSYDALGRTTSVAYPGGNQENISYSGVRTTFVDRNNHQKIQEHDAFGRLIKVEEYTGSGPYTLYATTNYQYDPRNLLTQVTDAQSNQTIIGYNGFGRKISMSDPDMGSWSYGYDVFGNLTSQTDARNCVTTISFDALNRPTGKSYSGPGACGTTPAATYTYDSIASGNKGIGHRTGMTDGSGSSTWVYNILGQVINQSTTVDGTTYTSGATLDAFGRLLTQTLPSGEVLNYGYNAMGSLSSLSGTNIYLSNIHYNASGQVTDQQFGNNILQQSCYDANTLRLSSSRAYPGSLQSCSNSPANPRFNLAYTYQPNGNISQMVDATRSEAINYTYDDLDRLLSASGPYNQIYSYNSIGNTTSKGTNDIFTTITTGPAGSHSCGLTPTGGVKCWGNNSNGQLGNGTTIASTAPVNVGGLSSGVIAIAAGVTHTCALTSQGGVKCWGDNTYGRLGDGTTTQRLTPVDVSGLSTGVIALTTGTYHTCALTSGGGIKCWGYNYFGQLGDGTTTDRNIPVDVSGLSSGVAAISAGQASTCARTAVGGMKCWGYNVDGRLGDGTTTQRLTPVNVTGLTSGVVIISAGSKHNCALTTSGGVKCWGQNTYGQLGDGTTTQRLTPADVSGLTSGVSAVWGGEMHTCALTTGGGMKCWGDNTYGQVGDGTTTQRLAPANVSGLASGVTIASAGIRHTCALLIGGNAKCWGDNSSGQLAIGPTTQGFTPVTLNGLNGEVFTSVTSGFDHTCALTPSGGVKCWGSNTHGQLGDGSTISRLTPVTVSGLGSGVSAIEAGGFHTCALTTAGGIKCWGINSYGTLGDGTTTNRSIPVDVSGLTSGVAAIASGYANTCALTTGGGVKCWGYNVDGRVGDGTTVSPRSTPVNVSGLTSGVSAITAGVRHTCALTTAGGVKCWGTNPNGQLGDGSTTTRTAPVDVSGLASGVSAISAGEIHTCARTTNGGVKCWGGNGNGQVGDGTNTQRLTPVDVSGITSGVVAISVGNYHSCARTTNGGMKCWGNNGVGQLGDGSTMQRTTPVDVSGFASGLNVMAPGLSHTCALTTSGRVKCWGENNTFGRLGDGTTVQRTTPVDVSGITNGSSPIDGGGFHTCALVSGGGVKCWGSNGSGQLGDGTTLQRTGPTDVSGLTSGAIAVSAGYSHTCALTTNGGVKCWGNNAYGQLGNGTNNASLIPVSVSGLTSGVVAITTGIRHSCVLLANGGAKCWGLNSSGQLGDGTTTNRNTPVDVSGLSSGVISIGGGETHTCALTTTGGVKCWGGNGNGQLGDGTNTQRLTAVDVSGLTSGIATISVGNHHTCALAVGGGGKCWGNNDNGRLGDGTTSQRLTPVDISGLNSGVTAITAGISHTCALMTNGGMKCWGNNTYGRLGDGTTTQRLTPVDVSGLTSGVNAITTGFDHTCAAMADGGRKCWGDNSFGQLGVTINISATPVSILASITTNNYAYSDSAHKHAVTSLSTGENYVYDANGNMTSRTEGGVTYTQVFDAENRLVSVTVNGQTTQFVYDSDGHLVKKIQPDNSRTLYIGGVYEVNKNASGTVTGATTYYPAAGAMRVNGTLYYALKDQVNSASVVLNASGNVTGEQRYYPFGETRVTSGSLFTDRLYTGQRQMANLGLYHYNARFYSPKLGRFISADTIVPGAGDAKAFDRYAYAGNNPILYNDPSGHEPNVPGGCYDYLGGGKCGYAPYTQSPTVSPTPTSLPPCPICSTNYGQLLSNSIEKFKGNLPSGFPAELLYAMAAVESGGGTKNKQPFQNSMVGGAMQITKAAQFHHFDKYTDDQAGYDVNVADAIANLNFVHPVALKQANEPDLGKVHYFRYLYTEKYPNNHDDVAAALTVLYYNGGTGWEEIYKDPATDLNWDYVDRVANKLEEFKYSNTTLIKILREVQFNVNYFIGK